MFVLTLCIDVNNANVTNINVPHYSTLSLKMVAQYIQIHRGIYDYLPDLQEMPKIPRQWTINVCATCIGEEFVQWVRGAIRERNENMKLEKNLNIEMDPELAQAFAASNRVASKFLLLCRLVADVVFFAQHIVLTVYLVADRGVGANMLKSATKRRRTTRQIREEKAMQEEVDRQSKAKVSQFDAMAAELKSMKNQAKSDESAANILSEMIKAGQLKMNDDGTVSNPYFIQERRPRE